LVGESGKWTIYQIAPSSYRYTPAGLLPSSSATTLHAIFPQESKFRGIPPGGRHDRNLFDASPLSRRTDSLVESGHFLYYASVLTRRLNPPAGETIPAILLFAENQAIALAQQGKLKHRVAYTNFLKSCYR
jgi:hypothetical protein